MRLNLVFILMGLFANFAFANSCGQLDGESIWNQIVDRGERYIIVWPEFKVEKKVRAGAVSAIAPFIQKIINKKLFDQFQLEDGVAYTFPVQNSIRNRDKKIIVSIQLKRIKKSQGVTVFELSNLKSVSPDENFDNLAALSLMTQKQLITISGKIRTPAALLDFLNITESSTRTLMIQLFRDTNLLDQIDSMPLETALTLERPELLMTGLRTASTRRLKFYRDQNGLIYLLALEG